LKISLANEGGRVYEIRCVEVTGHAPDLIGVITEIDLLTFSEPTFSRYTAGLMLGHGRTFLLRADEMVIGTCQCLRSWSDPDEAVLFSMALRPGWRGQGLGRYFVDKVLVGLAQSGLRSVVLEVDPHDRRAIYLYREVFGFQVYARIEDQYGKGKGKVHMRLELAPSELDAVDMPSNVTPLRRPPAEPDGSVPGPHCPPGSEPADIDPTGASTA